MNIITFLAIALFALMWIYIVLQANRISNLEKGQDLQMKINDELHRTFIRYSNGSLEHDLRVAERLLALEKDAHKQAEYNRSFAKSIRRVANLVRSDENADQRTRDQSRESV